MGQKKPGRQDTLTICCNLNILFLSNVSQHVRTSNQFRERLIVEVYSHKSLHPPLLSVFTKTNVTQDISFNAQSKLEPLKHFHKY